ncbi:DNA polymerase III subunit alpha [Aliiroseovarius sp. xm-m-379]|uniref:DNA polymerase III subunit alpha n=1 Tax=unclassified Aliiroseovarius TaxID=2623558 RepID=UPI0015698E1A|nr:MULTISPECIES: DNA polymerase III subunit alpha [unclassified Aliiroseovarius]NRP23554.1 DNA polymerase III subunit alpha [Aliiroseovarius sp. xm-m-379]NRP29199.1 DNA polymerase III subunit alpha [Aliiroseovarius sp. xm-m-314]NRP32353.1 DNA polymerase III subunit alpha [Aliiroseovarius sp. xm-a-104]NRP43924.1 DNA polymerase III subunit alpha [Aliiroseovarius sp. xm-m-378]NRP48774.1 DNA polymerase III subunit alpha [Aliiroseovarius sp. xm-m-354]
MSDMPRFIHLRTHTQYSLLEGAVPVKKLPGLCADMGMPAVAVTDTNNMFAALEFSETAAGAGIQPIIGCQVDVCFDPPAPGEKPRGPAPVVLLAQNEGGYENLMKLNSCLYVDKHEDLPQVQLDELEAHCEGLICLTGGAEGPVGQLLQMGNRDKAEALMSRLYRAFGDRLYVELQRHPGEGGLPTAGERATERGFVEMAYAMGIPLVATNDVFFPKTDLYEAHDALICIKEGAYVDQAEGRRRLTPQHYFKSPQEMVTLFADLPEAVENTVEIARRCAFKAYKRAPILPRFADDEVAELRRIANEGLQKRLAVIPHAVSVEEYQKRLDFELGIIEGMGFPGYFLIVADFIQWGKDHGIPVGPGRGSGAGSLVAYALTITDLDPLRYSLLFERFLNPERVSMPDFDIDFCMDRREEVIKYVQEKYGRDKVGQIITFGALLSKAAVRDVGRVLQMPYGQVDRLSKLIPVEGVKPVSIKEAIEQEPRLREEARSEEVVQRLLDYGQQVEGLLRNASTHAAGVVIGDRPLDALVPLYQDPRSDMPATQFNMKWVEQAGLVKFDFLGLKTLTVIQNAVDLIKGQGRDIHIGPDGAQLYDPPEGAVNEINAIPLDDKATYKLYASAKTVAVFQVESSGMMDALRRMKPTCIEDIVALVALYRPGPMENIPTYCEVKNGLKEIESVHPLIDHILEETQGIIVYQEQVMQIAQVMAGYSLGGADLLRRAMGKKIKEAMDAERPKFEKGAAENGVPAKKASEVFDLLEKFANYGFNKSHAAAYAVVSYQTGWLKANHPVEFMAGVMNCDIHLTDKLSIYAEEVRRGLDIEIIPPCVNRSVATFSVKDGAVVYALGALKNVGVEAMQLVVEGRKVDGVDKPFATLYDFARRVDLKKIGKRPMEMLARAGAFDQIDPNRRRVFDVLDALVAYSGAVHEQRASNQVSLFGEAGEDLPEPKMPPVNDWLPNERLAEEHKAIGFYLSGHPLDDYLPALKRKGVMTLQELREKAERNGAVVGKVAVIVGGLQQRKSGRGNPFFRMNISDPTEQVSGMALFADDFEACRKVFDETLQVVMTLEGRFNDGQFDPIARSVAPIEAVVADAGGMALKVYLDEPGAVAMVANLLNEAAETARNVRPGEVSLCLLDPTLPGEVEMTIGRSYPLNPQIKGALKSLDGVVDVEEV